MKNLELYKPISFDELIKHGLENGANVNNGMPWSWQINGKAITNENDKFYVVETIDGIQNFERGTDILMAFERGLKIIPINRIASEHNRKPYLFNLVNNHDTHCPGSCPM